MIKVKMPLLDHGYLMLHQPWGSDEDIIEAARMSTDKGFLGWEPNPNIPGHLGDQKLLSRLFDHRHTSPFEFAGLVVEVQAPIMVFREWHRHRTQSYNEMSARYTILPDLYYVPSLERAKAAKQSTTNKQGSQAGFTDEEAEVIRQKLEWTYNISRMTYEELLRMGVAREIARLCIPVSQYSRMRAAGNLHNWLHFLSLRQDEGAQWEIRQYANALATIVAKWFPRTWHLYSTRKWVLQVDEGG